MIKGVAIKHFQSIKELTLEFGNFTVLTGPSNSGKSAVFRAISHLVFNHRGRGFQPPGHSTTIVAMIVDGHKVVWRRATSPKYFLDGQVFDKLGGDVPEPVAQIVKMNNIDIGTLVDNINIRPQFSGPFFISATAPSRSKVIAFLAGSDSVTAASAEGLKRKRDFIANKEALQLRLKDVKAFIDKEPFIIEQLSEADRLLEQVYEYDKLDQLISRLLDLLKHRIEVSQSIVDMDNSLSQFDPHSFIAGLTIAEAMISEYDQSQDELSKYEALLDQRKIFVFEIGLLDSHIIENDNRRDVLEQQMHDLYATLTICPFCGQSMPEHVHD